MASPIKQNLEYVNKIAELSSIVGSALQNYIAARTRIRDYVISDDEVDYVEVTERLTLAILALQDATALVKQETLDEIRRFIDSIREWGAIAQQVHDGFSSYCDIVQNKVLANASTITKTGHVLLQTAGPLAIDIIYDVQTANVAIMSYLFNGEPKFVKEAQYAFDAAKAKIDGLKESKKQIGSALQTFAVSLNEYAAGFRLAVKGHKKAYTTFNDALAPLGDTVQSELEDFYDWLTDTKKGINDLTLGMVHFH